MLLGSGEQASFRPGEFGAYYRRVRSRLERFVADPPLTEPLPGRPLPDLRLQAALRRALGRRRPPLARRRAVPDARSSGWRPPGSRRSPALGRAPREPAPAGIAGRHVGEAARAGRAAALGARARRGPLRPPAAAAGERLRAAAGSVAGRPLLRLRGQPVLGPRREPRVPLGDPRRRAELHAAARPRPRDRAAGVRDVRRPRPRAARALSRPARLPLRAVRDHRAQAADGPLRHARGGARRPAPPRRLRRPLQGRPQRRARLAARLRAEGARGVSRLPPRRRRSRTAAPRSSSSSSGCRRATRRCSRRSTSTTARTASRRCCCATGCSSGAPRRSSASGRSRSRSPRSRSRCRPRRRRARSCARRCSSAGEELAAQLLDYHDRERKPVWWAFFDRIEMTPAELVEDADSIGRLAQVGEPVQGRPLARVHAHASRRRSTRSARGRARSIRRRARAPGEIVELDREERRLVLKRGPSFEEVPLPEALVPGPAVRHEGPGGRARAARPVAARGRRAATRRSSRSSAASRSTGRCRRRSSTR